MKVKHRAYKSALSLRYLITSLLLLCAFSTKVWALKEIPIDWTSYSENQVKLYLQEQDKLKRLSHTENLKLAKASLINGNTDKAKYFLEKINISKSEESKIELIKNHYLALITFIEDQTEKSLAYIEQPRLQRADLYLHTCLLKLINLTNYPIDEKYRNEMIQCQSVTQQYSKNQQFWLENIFNLKSQNSVELRGNILSSTEFLLSGPDILRIWLKMGLYFNQEDLILSYMENLTDTIYRSSRAREIIALLYYRQSNTEMTRKFIEDIESPNADNIRGNLSLEQKQYELAFGHYKLALQKKQNSLNALERSLPLAWMLEQWEDGINLLDSLIKPEVDPKAQQALRVALTYKTGDYRAAQEELNILEQLFDYKSPLEVNQLKSIIALQTKNQKGARESSALACRRYDGVNCWLSLQEMTWENLSELSHSDDEVYPVARFDIDELRNPSSIEPIEEIPIIDQDDIEEIDGEQVQLVPGEFY